MPRPKVSIIVPVFNAAPYLHACLDSIVGQTLSDAEIICIDDGSTETSGSILAGYAARFPHIRILTQPNAGAAAARNAGIAMAQGEYLSFLDADDTFAPDLLAKAWQTAQNADADVCIFRSCIYDERTGKTKEHHRAFQKQWLPARHPFSMQDMPEKLFQTFQGWAWDKLFKTSFLQKHDLLFPALPNSEDMMFVFGALVQASRIATVDEILLTQRGGNSCSLSHRRSKAPLAFYEALLALHNLLKKEGMRGQLHASFANWAVEYSLWNLKTLEEAARQTAIRHLVDRGLQALGIDNLTYGQAFDKKQFRKLRTLLYPSSPLLRSKWRPWSMNRHQTLGMPAPHTPSEPHHQPPSV